MLPQDVFILLVDSYSDFTYELLCGMRPAGANASGQNPKRSKFLGCRRCVQTRLYVQRSAESDIAMTAGFRRTGLGDAW